MIYPTRPTAPKAAQGNQAAATGRGCTPNVGTTLLSPGITWICSAPPFPNPLPETPVFKGLPPRGLAGSEAGVAHVLQRRLSGRCQHSCLHVHFTGQSPMALLSSMKATSSGRITKTDKVKETQLLPSPRCPLPGGTAARAQGKGAVPCPSPECVPGPRDTGCL